MFVLFVGRVKRTYRSSITQPKLQFVSDVFWARASIGQEVLDLWLDTYQTSRSYRKRGIVELELP